LQWDPGQPSLFRLRREFCSIDKARVKPPSCYPSSVAMETLFSFRASSPVGPLFLAASTKGLVRLEFEARVQNLPKTTQIQESKKVLAPYLRQLSEYFAGDRREFSLPLDLRGTDFQRACWHALIEFPTAKRAATAKSHKPSDTRTPTARSACRTTGTPSLSSFPATV